MTRICRIVVLIAFLLAPVGLVLTAACATLPVKERAVRTLDGTERLLAQVQDTERRICNDAAFQKAPAEPILVCAGPLSDATQLTTARHQRIAAALSRAFDAQIKAAVVLRAWRAGDPPPATLPDIMKAIEEIAAIVNELSPNSQVVEVLKTLLQVRTDLEALAAALKGATS
jgi:hypothetical protein